MCGITGFCDFTKSNGERELQAMTDELSHRGPDDQGVYLNITDVANVGLGHRRLSILDLSSKGKQPMHRGELTIVFNGEIYNYKEIRLELIKKGCQFYSHSDTEVILAAYQQWGMSSLNRFVGMFAYALLDRNKNKLFLVRDRVGVKPLYYYFHNSSLIFGSELKSFHKYPGFEKSINIDALAQYLKYSYIPTPYCIFNHTRKLQPGHYLEFDINSPSLDEIKYWDVVDAYNEPKINISYHEAVKETQKRLVTAFNYRMVADVPVGVFLSGGYDSTAVAAILQESRTEKIKTFTIGFHETDFNEAVEAKKIANSLGTDHTEYYATANDALGIIDELPYVFDEPFADNSVVPTLLVSKLAREQVKVVLSGDGGDEIFGGYGKFEQSIKYTQSIPDSIQTFLAYLMGKINSESIPYFSSTYNFSSRFEKMQEIWKSHSPFVALKYISHYITNKEINQLLKVNPIELPTYFDIENELDDTNDNLNKLLAIDYKTFLMDNNLVKIDRASMAVGLEGREPFLDQNVIEFVSRLPSNFKIKKGVTKALLKDIVHNYIDPKLMERPKKPFIAPLSVWFKKEMKELLTDHVTKPSLIKQNIFNVEEVLNLRNRFLDGDNISHQKIWNILLFQLWYNKWMIDKE